MASIRQNKISTLIKKELGNVFLREVKSVLSGAFVTVTSVRVTPDLGMARVYLSIMLAKDAKEDLLKHIKAHKGQIRSVLGNKVRNQLRIVPDLEFFIDDSLDYADRIDELLNE